MHVDLDTQARAAWPDIAARAGMAHDGWSLLRLSRRQDGDISRIAFLAQHPNAGQYTYKFQQLPHDQEHYVRDYQRYVRAFESFDATPTLRIVAPVFCHPGFQASIFRFVQGRPVSAWMNDRTMGHVQKLDLLRHVGQWLARYHLSQPIAPRVFKPKYTLDFYSQVQCDIIAGRTQVPAKQLFLKGIQKLHDIAPEFADQSTIAAAQHGDFHLGNVIYDGTCLTGIDISQDQVGPIGYDVARVLLHYSILQQNASRLPHEIIPQRQVDAFFSGYDLARADDPSVQFLLYARILATLLQIPQAKGDRTDAKQRTLQRIKPIAKDVFT